MANFARGTFTIVPNKEVLRGKSPELQSVYYWLCDHADENGLCFPSYERLAECSGVHRTTVIKKVAELECLGLIVKTVRTSRDEHKSNLYQLILVGGSSPELPPSSPERLELNPLNSTDTITVREETANEEETTFVPCDEDGNPLYEKKKKKHFPFVAQKKPPKYQYSKEFRDDYEITLVGIESMLGRKFIDREKQYEAMDKARVAGIASSDLKTRVKKMLGEEFWRTKGFDLTNVIKDFDRR